MRDLELRGAGNIFGKEQHGHIAKVGYDMFVKLLDEEGEVSNAIGRLTDKEKFDAMSYTEKQRYTLTLSEKYLKAVERYKKERAIGL